MRTEVPIIKRCCFCVPLRYGLLTWGYFKLFISILTFISLSSAVYGSLSNAGRRTETSDLVIFVFAFTAYLGEIINSLILVIGAHKKNLVLFRVYYIYSIVWWCIIFVIGTINVGMLADRLLRWEEFTTRDLSYLASDTALMMLNLTVQFYVILLVRSEMYKLNIGQFTFVNHAIEAECILKIDDAHIVREKDHDAIEDKNEKKSSLS